MKRCLEKNSFARAGRFFRKFEITDLEHYRNGFDDKNAADKGQKKFLFGQNRHRSERTADCQRTDIAHKNLRGRRVIPQKTERRADHRAAKNRQFGGFRFMRNQKYFRPTPVARNVGQSRQSRHRNKRNADRQTVHSVR